MSLRQQVGSLQALQPQNHWHPTQGSTGTQQPSTSGSTMPSVALHDWTDASSVTTTDHPTNDLAGRCKRKWHDFELSEVTSTDFVARGQIREEDAQAWFSQ